MGTKERKEREKARRKEQILDAAIQLISTQGFEQTTMDEIAEKAELSKGTLYLYFRDKNALFLAIKKRGLTQMHRKFSEILQQDLNGARLVKRMAGMFIEQIKEHGVFTKALALYKTNLQLQDNIYSEECSQLELDLLMLLTRALQIGIQDGSIRTSTEPKVLALQITFQMKGILNFYMTSTNQQISRIMDQNNITLSDMMGQFMNVHLNQLEIKNS